MKTIKSSLILILLSFTSGAFSMQDLAPVYWDAGAILESKMCFLNLVRKKMEVPEKNYSTTPPELRILSEIPLTEYQDLIEKAWGWRPDKMMNMFDENTNRIYLNNDTSILYSQKGRTPLDSLAHELVHYVQVKELGNGDGNQDLMESEAVQIQEWFRENYGPYIQGQKYRGPCE